MRHKIVACLFILSMQYGCNIQDECTSSETRQKLALRWRYGREVDPDLLKKEIKQATLYLFSQDNHFIQSWQIDNNHLLSSESRMLELSPGRYTIIVWGNLLDRTNVMPPNPNRSSSLSDFKIGLKGKTGETDYPTTDSLFHGQTTIDISNTGDQECTLPLRRECCYLKIYMENFSRVPFIKIQGMPGGCDFQKKLLPVSVEHTPRIGYNATSGNYETSLATLRPESSDKLFLELYEKGDTNPVYQLDLGAVFRELNIDPRKDEEVNILIRLKALEGNKLGIVVNNWHIIENIHVNM